MLFSIYQKPTVPDFFPLFAERMSAIARSSALLAPKLLKAAPAVATQTRSYRCNHLTTNYLTCNPIPRNLNLLEYQSKGLLENYGVTVQKFKMASNADEVREYTLTKQLIFVNPCAHRLRRSPRHSHVRSM